MDRPLPYLIGSQAFMEQEDVGLGDLSSDGKIVMADFSGSLMLYCLCPLMYCMVLFAEMSVDSDRDSVIESEDGKDAVVRLLFLFLSQSFSKLQIFHISQANLTSMYAFIYSTEFRW